MRWRAAECLRDDDLMSDDRHYTGLGFCTAITPQGRALVR
jgi:hypothetical protein